MHKLQAARYIKGLHTQISIECLTDKSLAYHCLAIKTFYRNKSMERKQNEMKLAVFDSTQMLSNRNGLLSFRHYPSVDSVTFVSTSFDCIENRDGDWWNFRWMGLISVVEGDVKWGAFLRSLNTCFINIRISPEELHNLIWLTLSES